MSNIQKLQDAGFTIHDDTPDEYKDVIEDLNDAEVALLTGLSGLLTSVNKRFERALEKNRDLEPYTAYLAPPPF
jgi:hypothetical protein